jgi:xanthine dehydrogenase accessory factor
MKSFALEWMRLTEAKQDHVVVSLTGIRGSAPQIVGSKMLVTKAGLHWGTVGGGKIEAHCIRFAQEILNKNGSAESKTWNLQTDIGMSCGGEVSLFFDSHFFSNWTVAIFGAGHVSQELCRIMQTWACQVLVFDTREEWISKLPNSLNIQKKLCGNPSLEVSTLPKNTFLLSMTQGHAFDVPVLVEAFKNQEHFAYIGVIGSEVKAQKIKKELKDLGISPTAIERLVCPVGLDIGDNTPAEISISIAAQLISLKPKENK